MERLSITFVLIIAFLVPGLLATYALGLHYPPVGKLFGGPDSPPDASGIVTLSFLALGCGIVVNAITWATIRPLILGTRIEQRPIDYSRLNKDNIDVFRLLFEEHYRYYQAYANALTAILLVSLAELFARRVLELPALIAVTIVCVILFCAARKALERTYRDLSSLLAPDHSASMAQGIALVADSVLRQPAHSETVSGHTSSSPGSILEHRRQHRRRLVFVPRRRL